MPRCADLAFTSTVSIPASTTMFYARKKFVINVRGSDNVVKIKLLGDNFLKYFLKGNGKIEGWSDEHTLRCHTLQKSLPDVLLIAELDGEKEAETGLFDMFSVMEKQKNGGEGVLLINGDANIFFVRDQSGWLRAVDLSWDDDYGWCLQVYSIGNKKKWDAGFQVFSSAPSLVSQETAVS